MLNQYIVFVRFCLGKYRFAGMTWQWSDARKRSQPLQRSRNCSRRILNIKIQKISWPEQFAGKSDGFPAQALFRFDWKSNLLCFSVTDSNAPIRICCRGWLRFLCILVLSEHPQSPVCLFSAAGRLTLIRPLSGQLAIRRGPDDCGG